ncbi:thioredoxin domain-containing protein [Streptomyces sp. B6B3]|uniref:DsbA family protein n=1 Tax=Streptomyces sp. B6B3 TaxID=3153570 RepID=UPI00325CA1F7
MSKKNRDGKSTARERLRQEREREQARERRLRLAKVVGATVLVLGVATAAGVFAAAQDGDGDDGGGDGQDAAPISVGEPGTPTLTVYEDFRCPACAGFEDAFRDTIHDLTEQGQLQVDYHLVTIIDGNMGGTGSKAAANAAACARDADRFTEYHDVLYRNQPEETDDAFADTDHLIDLAGEVEGLDDKTFRDCVKSGRHDEWVEQSTADFLNSDFNATPTVLLNGEDVYGNVQEPLTPESLRERVEELAAG